MIAISIYLTTSTASFAPFFSSVKTRNLSTTVFGNGVPLLWLSFTGACSHLQKDSKLTKRMQWLAMRCEKGFRRLQNPEYLHELKLHSLQRHILRATQITVYKLFHGYLNFPVEEFSEVPTAGYLRGQVLKVRQPRFNLARRKAALNVLSAGAWSRLPPHIAEAPTVSHFVWMPIGPPSSPTLFEPTPFTVLT